jgi:signal transduction histidine kinase
MRMVADNLLSNASKYTPAEGTLRVSLSRTTDGIVLEVADSGVGIAPDDKDRLFRKFSRIDNPLSAVGGTGLGLFLAAEIVRLHGGEITVESEPGRGSTFRVRIPGG